MSLRRNRHTVSTISSDPFQEKYMKCGKIITKQLHDTEKKHREVTWHLAPSQSHQEESEITISQLSLESFSSRTIFKPGGCILRYTCSDSRILILGSTSAGVTGFVCFGPVVFNVSNQGLWQRQSKDEGSKDDEDTGKVQHEGHQPWSFCPFQHHFQ